MAEGEDCVWVLNVFFSSSSVFWAVPTKRLEAAVALATQQAVLWPNPKAEAKAKARLCIWLCP